LNVPVHTATFSKNDIVQPRRCSESAIVLSLVTGTGSIYLFYKNLWNWLETTLISQTPLWVTTVLVLLVLLVFAYFYVKTAKILSKLNQAGQSTEPPLKTIFHNNLRRLTDGSGPYCPVCCDSDHKFIHMLTNSMGHLECPICKHYTGMSQPPFNKKC